MDFYYTWIQNKNDFCTCDWCTGKFRASSKSGYTDWKEVIWTTQCSKAHVPGSIVHPDEARCSIDKINVPKVDQVTNSKSGFNCKLCNLLNEYAEANQSDGTYICYNCK